MLASPFLWQHFLAFPMLIYHVNNPSSKKQNIFSQAPICSGSCKVFSKKEMSITEHPSITCCPCATWHCDRYTYCVKFQASIFELTSSFAPHLTYRILVNIETHRCSLQLAFLSTKGVPKTQKLTIDSNAKANLNKAFKRCGKSI